MDSSSLIHIINIIQSEWNKNHSDWKNKYKSQKQKTKALKSKVRQLKKILSSIHHDNNKLWELFENMNDSKHNDCEIKKDDSYDVCEIEETSQYNNENMMDNIPKALVVEIKEENQNVEKSKIAKVELVEKQKLPKVEINENQKIPKVEINENQKVPENVEKSKVEKLKEEKSKIPKVEINENQKVPENVEKSKVEKSKIPKVEINENQKVPENVEIKEDVEEIDEDVEEIEEDVEEIDEESEEEEVYLVEINGTNYFTTNETNGMIYAETSEGEVGDEVGYFEDGEPGFYEE